MSSFAPAVAPTLSQVLPCFNLIFKNFQCNIFINKKKKESRLASLLACRGAGNESLSAGVVSALISMALLYLNLLI